MHKFWLFILAPAILPPAILQGAAVSISEPAYWRYAHSDAKVLAGVEWKRMAQTPAGVAMRAMANSADIPGLSIVDLLDRVDRVLISSPGGANAKLNRQAPMLIVATGRFDLQRFRELALREKATIKPYKNADLIYPPGYQPPDSVVAMVDSQTILIGEKPVVTAAIDRAKTMSGALSSFNRLFARASLSAGQHDLWMISSVGPSEIYSGAGPQAAMLTGLLGADLGVDFYDGLRLGFRLATKSVESAEGIAGAIRTMFALAATQSNTPESLVDGEMRELLSSMDIRTESSDVKISLKMDNARLQRTIQQARMATTKPKPPIDLGGFQPPPSQIRQASRQTSMRLFVPVDVSALAHPAPIQEWAPPPTLKKMVIRIEGLDEGTREIPYLQTPLN